MKITSTKKTSVILGLLTIFIGEQHVCCGSAFVIEGWNCILLFLELYLSIFLYFFVKTEKFLIMFYRSFLICIYTDTATSH